MSVNKTPRGLERGVKGVGASDQRNVCLEKSGRGEEERRRGEERNDRKNGQKAAQRFR